MNPNVVCFLKKFCKPALAVLVVCLSLVAENVFAQAGMAGSFLRVGMGARAKAMGDAYSALARGVEASFYNPAGLPLLEKREAIASYRFLSLDREFTFIGFGTAIKPSVDTEGKKVINGGLALAWLRAGVSNIDGRNSDGAHFDNLSNSENAFMMAFALRPDSHISIGLVVKILWNLFPDLGTEGQTISASGVGFDFGVLYRFSERLAFSATVKEINSRYRWNTQDLYEEDGSETINVFPKLVRYGLAVSLPRYENITLAVDFEQVFESKLFGNFLDERIHVGAEGVFAQDIMIRAGFDDGNISAGAGYRFPLLGKQGELSYAFAGSGGRPEAEHIFTWLFRF